MRIVAGVVALVSALWAAVVMLSGGINVAVAGLRLTAADPWRPLAVACAAALVYVWLAGWRHVRDRARMVSTRIGSGGAAVLLAVAVASMSFAWNDWAAGGSDSFAYVQQADGWLAGSPIVPMPIAADVPWPEPLDTFTPFGYRPDPTGRGLIPMTGPGLPLVMAGLKAACGHPAMFCVAPLSAGVLVMAVWALGRRSVGTGRAGLTAAWLVAASPTVLLMSHSVMSDVPVTACWTLALACVLGLTPGAALGAGLWMSAVVMIRPNLAPLAAVPAMWLLWQDLSSVSRRPIRVFAFCAGVLPGALGLAAFNHEVYGSALRSGYGRLDVLFSWQNVWPNLRQYFTWLIDTQTPAVMLGVLALTWPLPSVWPTAQARGAAWLLRGAAAGTCIVYLGYQPFDAWWYLRFLMPAWPAVAVGMAALMREPPGSRPPWRRLAASSIALALGVTTAVIAIRLGVFPPGEGERRYATIAALVAERTEPGAVIITGQHTGAMRYYGGRLTLRYDALYPDWFERTVQWFSAHQRPVYVLLEDWEQPKFVHRFAATGALGRLDFSPILAYTAASIPGHVFLFDPRRPDGPTERPLPIRNPRPLAPLPATVPH